MKNRAKSIEVTAVVSKHSEQKLIFIDSSPYMPFVKTIITIYPNWIFLEPDLEAERISKLRKMSLAQIVALEEKRKKGTLTKEEMELITPRRKSWEYSLEYPQEDLAENSQKNPIENPMEQSQANSQEEPMPTRKDLDQLLQQKEVIPLKMLEKLAICQALVNCKGNKTQAAKKLGISEKTIYNKIKEFNLRYPFVNTENSNDSQDDCNG